MWYDLKNISYIKADQNIDKDVPLFDFGHGGGDSGCIFYNGNYEKNYNLTFGMMVYNIVKPYLKKVYLTRSSEKGVTLSSRANIMSKVADTHRSVQVYSFHVNAFNKVTKGAEVLLSSTTRSTSSDYIWSDTFLKHYRTAFNIPYRRIVRKKGKNGLDYYYLHRNTPDNCKVKYLEMFFGDNRDECKFGTNSKNMEKMAFFLASYILKRYGITIEKPKPPSKFLYTVQTGAFNDYKNALEQQKVLKSKGFDSIIKSTKL